MYLNFSTSFRFICFIALATLTQKGRKTASSNNCSKESASRTKKKDTNKTSNNKTKKPQRLQKERKNFFCGFFIAKVLERGVLAFKKNFVAVANRQQQPKCILKFATCLLNLPLMVLMLMVLRLDFLAAGGFCFLSIERLRRSPDTKCICVCSWDCVFRACSFRLSFSLSTFFVFGGLRSLSRFVIAFVQHLNV